MFDRMYTCFNEIFHRDVVRRCEVRGGLYRVCIAPEAIEAYQIKQFNVIWRDAFEHIPLYGQWRKQHGLPTQISNLNELGQWPLITKRDLQQDPNLLSRSGQLPKGYVLTGGSTGQPVRLGSWYSPDVLASLWLGRISYGIMPGDRTFHLWGHRHLYGRGLKRAVKIREQQLRDILSNRMRFPAYDLSEEAMRKAFDCCNTFRPEIFSGFSSAALAFCRSNADRRLKIAPKALLFTAGPLSRMEQKELREYFSAPLCMEYGSADCSVMAYTNPTSGNYRTFWDTHLLQAIKDENDELKNIVTRLTPCYFPIIRYDIGDYLNLATDESRTSVLNIIDVKGRPSDIIVLDNGVKIWAATVSDCVKQISSVTAVQIHLLPGKLQIWVEANGCLTDKDYRWVRERFCEIVNGVENYPVEILQKDKLQRTPAGKIPLVIREK